LVITIDFETYYDREFSLSKITTEEYVRDRRFEVIGVGVKVDEGETEWFSGTEAQTKFWLGKFKWNESLVLAHNMMFDGAIMAWRFNINPKGWLDTLCMGRAVDGVEVSGSLKNLAERYEVGEKGTEVVNALGKRRKDFSEEELARYGEYCRNDVELTYKLFNILRAEFPTKELKVIDLTLRMFTHPVLKLDLPLLEQHLLDVVERKEKLLEATSASKDDLMSNDKFAQLLIELGVDPPRKISLTTGREAWAFAKTDEDFKALSDHPDDRVQALVAARLGNKTTLEETRTQRFIDIAKRGLMPTYTKSWHRLSMESLKKKLRKMKDLSARRQSLGLDTEWVQLSFRLSLRRLTLSYPKMSASESSRCIEKPTRPYRISGVQHKRAWRASYKIRRIHWGRKVYLSLVQR
jgi:hypothetical protein